ncbi:NmrA family NAD(P)-binding protein [Aminobacter sp. LjRoot7]|uniref:NmrA family NAD(P)-binding protein n=1 Tax=Aminobacter sp. LjRoot7 TaxID=3342335 RepID=UPI003ECE65BA
MTILVTGATGNVGGAIIHELVERGARVRAMTRNPARARLPEEVEVVPGDFGDPDSLASAFAGAKALHLINYDAKSGAHMKNPETVVALAKAAGIERVTSFRGEAPGALEQALRQSGLAWTDFFIPVEFMTNALQWAQSVATEGVVRAFGPSRSAMIHEVDIGTAIANALTAVGHAGKSYTLTGPEALTPQDKVDALCETTGKAIRLIELSEAEARAKWQARGTPAPFIEFLVDWHVNTPESAYQVLPTVEQLTGCLPRTFRQWAFERAAAFRG